MHAIGLRWLSSSWHTTHKSKGFLAPLSLIQTQRVFSGTECDPNAAAHNPNHNRIFPYSIFTHHHTQLSSQPAPNDGVRIDKTRAAVLRVEAERAQRRQAMKNRRVEREAAERLNIAQGNPGDVDFIGMVGEWRESGALRKAPHVQKGGE